MFDFDTRPVTGNSFAQPFPRARGEIILMLSVFFSDSAIGFSVHFCPVTANGCIIFRGAKVYHDRAKLTQGHDTHIEYVEVQWARAVILPQPPEDKIQPNELKVQRSFADADLRRSSH